MSELISLAESIIPTKVGFLEDISLHQSEEVIEEQAKESIEDKKKTEVQQVEKENDDWDWQSYVSPKNWNISAEFQVILENCLKNSESSWILSDIEKDISLKIIAENYCIYNDYDGNIFSKSSMDVGL